MLLKVLSVHLYELIRIEVTQFFAFFFPCPIRCILLTAWIIRNYFLIVVDLVQLVNIKKFIKAARKIHVYLQFLPLFISQHYAVHMALLFLQHGNKAVNSVRISVRFLLTPL
jgi:hypothetical protein